ncbi:SufB/SufD family protein [Hutsoniella sourekii]
MELTDHIKQETGKLPVDGAPFFKDRQAKARDTWQSLQPAFIERTQYQDWPLYQETIDAGVSSQDLVDTFQDHIVSSNQDQLAAQVILAGNQTQVTYKETQAGQSGLIVMDLFEAMETYPDLVEEHLFQVLDSQEDKVAAYHTAHLNGGIFVYVPKDMELDLSIEGILLQDSRQQQAFNKHILLVADTNSRVQYIERLGTVGHEANAATVYVEVITKAGAQVKYVALDGLAQETTAMVKRYGQTGVDSQIDWVVSAMNQGDSILDIDTNLMGQGSTSDISITAIANGDQEQIVNAHALNVGNHTVGHIFQHGVTLDQARLTFNGIGRIVKNAKNADAQQESRIMMLSPQTRGDVNPMLYIDEFEVTAGHAGSIGQLDPEQLYYLMSRGLSQEEAEYLLIRGFLGQVIMTIPSKEIRSQMVATIDEKLSGYRNQ